MSNVTINLTKPVEVFGKRVSAIELKEPTGGVYTKLGDPRVLVFNASGSGYWVPQQAAITAYLDQLIVHDAGGGAIMALLGLEDSMAIQEALFAFFFRRGSEACRQKIDALVFSLGVLMFDVAQAMSISEIDEAFDRAVAWQREVQETARRR
jgi:hypothetical protein